MEEGGTDDFSALVAAALAARQDSTRDDGCFSHERTPSQHQMLSRINSRGLFPDTQAEESLDLAVRLKYRLDVFRAGSASWGLVDGWRPDGSAYKRHGIVIELEVDVSDAILDSAKRQRKQRHIREAIDLVQLVIALDPIAMRKRLKPRSRMLKRSKPVNYVDELIAVARGVPWELRLKFRLPFDKAGLFQSQFASHLMQQYDEALSDSTFDKQRRELLEALVNHEYPTLEHLARVAANSVVRAEIKIIGYSLQDSVLATEDFFQHVQALLADLDRYQSLHNTRRWNKHAPFRVEKAELKMRSFHITSDVLQLARHLMDAPIPVVVARLELDFRLVSCTDSDLRKLVQVLTTGATRLCVGTGFRVDQTTLIDAQRQNRYKRIMSYMEVITQIERIHTLHIGALLGMCTSRSNRQAVWRGLFGDVLWHHDRLDRLTFSVGFSAPQMILTEDDEELIEECVAWARQANPSKQFRVQHLEIHFKRVDSGALRALLSAFDDVQQVSFYCLDDPQQVLCLGVFHAMFQFPSLDSVSLNQVAFSTMDLFNPSIVDASLPTKPTLKKLDLFGVEMDDPASLSRFIQQLKSAASTSSAWVTKLEHLDVFTSDRGPILSPEDYNILDRVLTVNRTLRHIGISVGSTDPEHEVTDRSVLRKHSGRQVLPSEAQRLSEIAKARKTAFLSTMRDTDSARCRLDATLVSKIFAFSAPHARRTTPEDRYL